MFEQQDKGRKMSKVEKIQPVIIGDPKELARRLTLLRKEGKSIGLVPTMGALHPGHLSLVLASKSENDITVVSIFVNPIQFAPGEDYEKYPRSLNADLERLADIDGVDFVFAPSPNNMYPQGFDAKVHIGGVSQTLEGEFRPTHFDGVATVVLKLFNITQANRAYFGQKDFQQIAVVKKMVSDLNVPIEIIPCPILRDTDGLALSSRNQYLSPEERKNALVLNRSLKEAQTRVKEGMRDTETLAREIREKIEAVPNTKIDYIAIVDPETLRPMARIAGNTAILLAVRFGATRLIDNWIIRP